MHGDGVEIPAWRSESGGERKAVANESWVAGGKRRLDGVASLLFNSVSGQVASVFLDALLILTGSAFSTLPKSKVQLIQNFV